MTFALPMNQAGHDARIKRIYRIDISGVTPKTQSEGNFPVLGKTLAMDVLPVMQAGKGWVHDKLEGFARTVDGTVYAVTDNDGATATDNVKVTVNAASNQAPVANAGTSLVIVQPADQATLNGSASSDADGSIVSYEWSQVSGPSNAYLADANKAIASASRFDVGVYTFRLKVTDDKGATASATMTVTVREAVNNTANQPPVAHSGWDRTLYLPETSMNLDGTRSYDPDGRIVAYSWTQISGPRRASFAYTNRAFTLVYNMTREGVYQFRLKVTDDQGASAYSTVTVTVARKRRYRGNNNWYGRGAANDSSSAVEVSKTPEAVSAAIPEDESIADLKASLYPNPASSQVQVSLDNNYQGKLQVAVYSMNGERALAPLSFEKKTNKWQTTVNIQSLKAGMYNLEIVMGKDSRKTLRFIKL